LTQEAFLQLFRHRRQLSNVQNHRAWIYRIASNTTFNALKKRNRFRWLPWKEGDEAALKSPDTATNLGEQEQVQQALNAIEPKYRAPLILFGQYGLSIRDIAEIMELSENNVKVRLHRARKMFKAVYEGTW
jgi:RNA polymerase sigma-70 factor (ECF subfamily)